MSSKSVVGELAGVSASRVCCSLLALSVAASAGVSGCGESASSPPDGAVTASGGAAGTTTTPGAGGTGAGATTPNGTGGMAPAAGGAGSPPAGGQAGTTAGAGGVNAGTGGVAAGTGGTAGSTGGAGGAPANPAGGFQCPADFGTPNLTAPVETVAGVPLADNFAQGFGILEGPVWLDGALYFSEFGGGAEPASRIYKLPGGTQPEIFLTDSGSNGLALRNGQLLLAKHGDGSISSVSPADKALAVVAAMFEGQRFSSPNDLAVRSDGTIYFTDPNAFQAPQPPPQMKTSIYRVTPEGMVELVDDTKQGPNGITLLKGEGTLVVSGSIPLTAYPVMADGSVGPGADFGPEAQALRGSDGMVIDCAGNLYVANNSNVEVLDAAGTKLGTIAIADVQMVSNVAFGGAEGKTLFITTLGSVPKLAKVELGIVGYPF